MTQVNECVKNVNDFLLGMNHKNCEWTNEVRVKGQGHMINQLYSWVNPKKVIESIGSYNANNKTNFSFIDWAIAYIEMVKTSDKHQEICKKFGILRLMLICKNKIHDDVSIIMIKSEKFDITMSKHMEYEIVDEKNDKKNDTVELDSTTSWPTINGSSNRSAFERPKGIVRTRVQESKKTWVEMEDERSDDERSDDKSTQEIVFFQPSQTSQTPLPQTPLESSP